MVIGELDGFVHFYENTAGPNNTVQFVLNTPNFMGIDVGANAAPQLFDLNKDGLLDLVIGENTIKVYSNLVFQAVGLASTVDLTPYTMVHIDVYTTTENVFKFKMADFGADNLDEYPNVDDTESEVESTTTQAAGVWVGHDIPLSSFTTLGSMTNVGQLQVILGTKGNVWLDNIYFY